MHAREEIIDPESPEELISDSLGLLTFVRVQAIEKDAPDTVVWDGVRATMSILERDLNTALMKLKQRSPSH